jgi:hypothetical protein
LEHLGPAEYSFRTTALELSSLTSAIRKVTSGGLLTKQAMSKILLYTKNAYTHQLPLNVVTIGIEALVVLGNEFLYACVKEVCRL